MSDSFQPKAGDYVEAFIRPTNRPISSGYKAEVNYVYRSGRVEVVIEMGEPPIPQLHTIEPEHVRRLTDEADSS